MGSGAWCNVSKQTELEKIDRTLKDTEMRIKTVEQSIVVLEKEIANLVNLEKKLKENISCLKRESIIAIAQEFRKAKEDLKSAKTKIASLTNDKNHFKKVIVDMVNFLEKSRKELAKLENSNNVLKFKLEKKS